MVYNDHLELFVAFEITKSCNLSLLWVCVHPSCVEVMEIEIWVYGYPSCVEVIVVEFSFMPLSLLYRRDCYFWLYALPLV